jgi:c-di-GMP phosphodiesterase
MGKIDTPHPTPVAAAPHAPRIKEFFLARQPILNRDQQLYAYELLFRSAAAGPASVTDDLSATAAVIAHAAELGIENVIGASPAFINVNAAVLFSDFVHFLPRHTVVLEILETVEADDALVARIEQLALGGYRFALDDVVNASDRVMRLLPLVDIVKIDVTQLDASSLAALSATVRLAGKKLLAEKVETLQEFDACMELGFDYFQGYYFAKPLVFSGMKLPPERIDLVRLMAQLSSDADVDELERSIKHDAALGLTLLRMVNAPVAGVHQRIDSVGQALQVLGRRRLQRWLQILIYAEPGKGGAPSSPLLAMATTRGRLLELISEKIRPGDRAVADVAFTVGVMSLTDALFGAPMEKILEGLAVADEIRRALLEREGFYGDMLRLAESVETIDDAAPLVAELLQKLGLSLEDFNALQLEAFEWSGAVAHQAA